MFKYLNIFACNSLNTDLEELLNRRVDDHERSLNEMDNSIPDGNIRFKNFRRYDSGRVVRRPEESVGFNVDWKNVSHMHQEKHSLDH